MSGYNEREKAYLQSLTDQQIELEARRHLAAVKLAKAVRVRNLAAVVWGFFVSSVTVVWGAAALLMSERLGLLGLVLLIPTLVSFVFYLNRFDDVAKLEGKQ